MEKIKKIVKELRGCHHYSSIMGKTMDLILEDKMNSMELNQCLSDENMSIDDIKPEALSVIIDYSKVILEDGIITKDEIRHISMLKLFFHIREGEFFEFGKKEEVTDVILQQLRKLYEDNNIDKREAVMKTELQELFGLCYDDFLEINNIAAKEALERGADISKLDTFI
jgi:hypothetical protein